MLCKYGYVVKAIQVTPTGLQIEDLYGVALQEHRFVSVPYLQFVTPFTTYPT